MGCPGSPQLAFKLQHKLSEKQGFGEDSVPHPSLSYLQMQFILVRSRILSRTAEI